jgi:hypothetical protein
MEKKTTYSVMVSSTYTELVDHRRAVTEAMLSQHLFPIRMEDDAALPDQDLIDASLAKVDEADAYVGLISYRYGQQPECQIRNPDKLSLTELEFRRAVARGFRSACSSCTPITRFRGERSDRSVASSRSWSRLFNWQ